MTINGKELHVWAALKTVSGRRSSAIASPLKKDFRHRKADEEKRREFLYAPRGQKCAGVSGWSKTQTNIIGALCGTVPLAFIAFDYAWTAMFSTHGWLKYDCRCCLRNCDGQRPFHKRQDMLNALQAEGHTVLRLPPYSPDCNPIEKTWAWIKRLRKPWRLADVNALLFWFLTLVTLY